MEVAEEVFQEVGLKVVEQSGAGAHVENFLPWVRQIARNLIADYYRNRSKTRALRELPESMTSVVCDAFEEYSTTPESNRRQQRVLRDCLHQLSERMQELLSRRYRDSMSLGEIASRVGWSLNSLKVGLCRARRTVQECVRAKLREAEVG
jgi:RNA polymerase sigma-70 factor (ECF subfamily)